MAKHSYTDWLTKEEAATALQVSTKTVEKFAAEGKLHSAMTKNPETGANRVVIHPRDVEKLRKERLPDAKPFVLPKDRDGAAEQPATRAVGSRIPINDALPGSNPYNQAIATAGLVERSLTKTLTESISQAAGHIFAAQAATVPLHRRLYLTRAEAAAYSGLPLSEIVKRIENRELPAIRTGRGWRIPRRDLERMEIHDVWTGAKLRRELAAPPQTEPPATERTAGETADEIAEAVTELGGEVGRY